MVLQGTLHGVPFTHKIRDLVPNTGGSGGTVIPPAVSTIKKYTKNIGDGINKQINVNHNLNTQDITFSVWTRTLPPEYVVCDVIILSENTIQLLFEKVPTPDQYRVVVMG